jgi:hypothetical protein
VLSCVAAAAAATTDTARLSGRGLDCSWRTP